MVKYFWNCIDILDCTRYRISSKKKTLSRIISAILIILCCSYLVSTYTFEGHGYFLRKYSRLVSKIHYIFLAATKFDEIFTEYILYFCSLCRYLVLASSAMTAAPDHKAATSICFETIGLEEDKYRLGHTKLFFRTGKPFHE